MQVNTEDITVPWGRAPDPLDIQNGRWRMAVFQDVQESNDKSKLYFLYDPVADETSGTTGGRKGAKGLVVFDVNLHYFTREIPIHVQGNPKFLFSLKCPSPQGGTSLILITEIDSYGQAVLLPWRVDLLADGMNLESEPRALLENSIPISGDFIVSMREDAPEVVILTSPGLTVWRINCLANQPSSPTSSYSVPNADLSHFYDAFLSQGNIYLLSASPDGHLDYSRIHILQITGQSQIRTQMCTGDPQRGTPCARKQAALDSISGFILLAGGEVDYGDSVTRLVDYWALNLSTFTWIQIPAQMPIPLIEPRLTATNSGTVYLWGDFDQPLPGMPPGTHVRILKVTGFDNMNPPPYSQALNQSSTAPYPSANSFSTPYSSSGAIYPSVQGGYPQLPSGNQPPFQPSTIPYGQPSTQGVPPSYLQQNPYPQSAQGAPPSYTQQSPYPQPPQQAPPGQYAYYPPSGKKECSLQ
uniref:Uncharacterized protein n=1 Tax=Ascaris lumbricoides TaxID=6252 RepID=A0A9J2PYC5_ASCLU